MLEKSSLCRLMIQHPLCPIVVRPCHLLEIIKEYWRSNLCTNNARQIPRIISDRSRTHIWSTPQNIQEMRTNSSHLSANWNLSCWEAAWSWDSGIFYSPDWKSQKCNIRLNQPRLQCVHVHVNPVIQDRPTFGGMHLINCRILANGWTDF